MHGSGSGGGLDHDPDELFRVANGLPLGADTITVARAMYRRHKPDPDGNCRITRCGGGLCRDFVSARDVLQWAGINPEA